jgi:hypothetical protein
MNLRTSAVRLFFPVRAAALRQVTPAIVMAVALAACGSSPSNTGIGADASESLMSFTSHRPASAIASCLASHVGGMHRSTDGATTQLAVGGSAHHYAWSITLTPAATGTLVSVRKASNDDGPVPEPNMRYYIARCTT